MKTRIVKVWVDESCSRCRETIESVDGLNKPRIPTGKVLAIVPDYNVAGILTKYHFELYDKER